MGISWGWVLQGQAARSPDARQQYDGDCRHAMGITCAVQQACELLDNICFWNNETQPDAVCVNLLADTICDPTAHAFTPSASVASYS